MKLELAKVGIFGQDGQKVTEQDLREAVETFKGESPVTLGHALADFMPAFGWVKSVSFESPSLYGEVELSDLLQEAYGQGMYKKWSIGLPKGPDGKRYLHHLAFLGAVPPKIRDLRIMDGKVINMADMARWTYEFSEKGDTNMMSMQGMDVSKPMSTSNMPDALKKESPEKQKAFKEADNEAKGQGKPEEDCIKAGTQAMEGIQMADEKKTDPQGQPGGGAPADGGAIKLADAIKPLEDKIRGMENQLRAGKKDLLKQAMAGKLPEAKHNLVLSLADQLPLDDTIELADDKGNRIKRSAFDILVEVFNALPQPVKPGLMEMGDLGKDAAGKDINTAGLAGKF